MNLLIVAQPHQIPFAAEIIHKHQIPNIQSGIRIYVKIGSLKGIQVYSYK